MYRWAGVSLRRWRILKTGGAAAQRRWREFSKYMAQGRAAHVGIAASAGVAGASTIIQRPLHDI